MEFPFICREGLGAVLPVELRSRVQENNYGRKDRVKGIGRHMLLHSDQRQRERVTGTILKGDKFRCCAHPNRGVPATNITLDIYKIITSL